jgi:hypothetical protein
MNWLESSDQILAILVIGVWMAGLGLLLSGRKVKDLNWISISILCIFMIGVAVDLFFVNRDMAGAQKIWARGWIGPRDQNGAITIGILEDPLGLFVAGAMGGLATLFLANRWLIQKESNPERMHAGVLFGVAGVAVSWLSLTPWFSILGLVIASIGGFIALSATQDPETMARFGRERTIGFLLSFLGAAVLAGGRSALAMDRSFALAGQSLPQVFDVMGGTLLLLGIYLHLQPFPFLGWLCRPAKVSSGASVVIAQLFSAVASFGLAVRFEPELRTIGVFPFFEVFAMSSAVLTAFCGLSQESWKTALPLWVSTMLSVAFGCLCFAGGMSAAPVLAGVVFSAFSLALLASAQGSGARGKRNQSWFKFLSVVALAPGLGFIGFVSSGGFVRMMSLAGQDTARSILYALVLLPAYLLLWKNFFSIRASTSTKSAEGTASALPLVSVGILLAFSVGLLWTGTLTGGVIPHDPDRLFPSWLSTLFGLTTSEPPDQAAIENGTALGQSLLWSTLVLAAALSFWLFGRGQDLAVNFLASRAGVRKFFQTGYSIDRVGELFVFGLKKLGSVTEKWVSEKISTDWIPLGFVKVLTVPARRINEADQKLYKLEETTVRQWSELPAKVLQLVQSGDVQWYLFFAIGCAVAILIHFLRV